MTTSTSLPSVNVNKNLREACQNSDEPTVKQLLKDGADSNSKDSDGFTALHYAASVGSLGCCRTLLNSNCDINSKSENNCTPLYMASQSGYTKTVNELISKGAQVDVPTLSLGHTPLLVACEFGYHYIIQSLLSAGASVKTTLKDGFTALHIAAQFGRAEAIPVLLAAGCDVNVKTNDGWTPLMIAVRHGSEAVVEVLLNRQLNVKVDELNNDGICALTLAVIHHPSLIHHLVGHSSCQLNTADKQHGWTPVHYAVEAEQLTGLLSLLSVAGCDVNVKDKKQQTPLHLAAAKGQTTFAEVLITAGANINLQDKQGHTAAQIATSNVAQVIAAAMPKQTLHPAPTTSSSLHISTPSIN